MLLSSSLGISRCSCTKRRLFSINHVIQKKNGPLPPRPKVPEGSFTETFLKGSGPGGQKINKTSSAVQLRHLESGIVVKCQETRSRTQNRKIARQSLADRLDDIHNGAESRRAIKTAIIKKKKSSAKRKSRRKYRNLAEKAGELEEAEEAEEAEEVEEAEEAEETAEAEKLGSMSSKTQSVPDGGAKVESRDDIRIAQKGPAKDFQQMTDSYS